jgi:nicotinic acid phosphoribosyltransferase
MNYNPLLLIDFYKSTHHEQYPAALTKMVSYYTPRMSRLKDNDMITMFGLQGFIKEYLIKGFNDNFFSRPEDEVVAEYERILDYTLGKGAYQSQKIRDLHQLGYLPLEISAVPEGVRTKVGVPQIEITNTHPNFVWLVNTIETMLSCTMWHTQVSAEVGYRYRQIVDKYVALTCDDTVSSRKMLGDFSMRGQHSVESATKSSAAWALSFDNTATVPAIMWLEDNYNCDVTKETVARGAISTEHSVMCSNFAVDGDEITHIKRLLTEIYPNHSFSMVSDSYDYWRLVTELLPQCKKEILAHNGTLSIRGDSGDPIEVLAGKDIIYLTEDDGGIDPESLFCDEDYTEEWVQDWCRDSDLDTDTILYFYYNGHYNMVKVRCEWTNERGAWTDMKYYFVDDYVVTWRRVVPSAELLGTVWALDQIIGHTVNSKGYKVLNPQLKAIYGDSITPQRCEEIYRRLAAQGYAANNVVLGVGSFSMMCLEVIDEDDKKNYSPYTRDTFGIAVKATYAEDKDGNPINIFKQPKALSWKRSQKGCCIVAPDGLSYTDEHTWSDVVHANDNLLEQVFCNGELTWEQDLQSIRTNMYGAKH